MSLSRKSLTWTIIGGVAFLAIAYTGYFHMTRNSKRHVTGTLNGQQLYHMYCSRCHTPDEPLKNKIPLDAFALTVKNGRTGGMPSFRKTFADQEFEPLYRYLKSQTHGFSSH